MNREIAWNDLSLILAIAEAGTLSGAGRRLGVSHATVFRRLARIESRMGVKLFERSGGGYELTPAGEVAAGAARRIEAEVLEVERRVAGQDLRPSGSLRVTTTDTLLIGLLSPILAGFRDAYRDISLEIAISNQVLNLTKREADVAIRPTQKPQETLVGRKIGTIAQAIYGRADLYRAEDLRAADWVGPDPQMAYRDLERWMAAQGLDGACRVRVDSLLGMFAAARDGAGLAVLPCYLADAEPRLTRFGDRLPDLASDLWLLTHADLRKTARLRVFMTFVAARVRLDR